MIRYFLGYLLFSLFTLELETFSHQGTWWFLQNYTSNFLYNKCLVLNVLLGVGHLLVELFQKEKREGQVGIESNLTN